MPRTAIQTEDGSTTLRDSLTGDTYHSIHGAIAESEWIYIGYGLSYCAEKYGLSSFCLEAPLHILEMGFGTGLNALLTAHWAMEKKCPIYYHTVERYPLAADEYSQLAFQPFSQEAIAHLHRLPFGKASRVNPYFTIYKEEADFGRLPLKKEAYHLVYYDAFAPDLQPYLWSESLLANVFLAQRAGGVVTTYSAKGSVYRALKAAGYEVQRLPGPPGKREVIRAERPLD